MAGPSLLLPALLATAALAQTSEDLLLKVDRLRHPWPAFSMDVEILSGRTEQRWKVSARENGDARVEGLSPEEMGRAVLLLGEDMWLLLPGSKRPLRVTPQQRMLGPAAGGDLARSRFAKEYDVKERVEDTFEGETCWKLDLTARKPSASYRTARLWIGKATSHPLKADYFLASGRLARTTRFDKPVEARGILLIPGLRIEEPRGGSAVLRFSAWRPGAPDPALFQLPSPK